MPNMNTLDITPTPRILRTLGEIPFATWQCLAELIDNSVDAFLSDESAMAEEQEKKITVTWTSDTVASADRTIEIADNACGMSIEQLQNAVRAGYSSNDPIGNLGLFGMGFNISTARLGENTTIMSTRSGDADWVGLKIDFEKLIKTRKFEGQIIRKAKTDPTECGTKITISRLKPGILAELPSKENDIRQRLEAVYAPLLNNQEISIYIKGKQLRPRNHCVWSESRYVRYNDQNVSARIHIDRNLGDALFDLVRNSYLTADESEQYYIAQQEGRQLPENIIERSKRLTGWLGIQRYADPSDFGIDFIRNGRKILTSDKSLFQYENPLTGQKELQYPLELGTTVGGRIVGELHVDYLLPTYQKNDFDRTDASWMQTIDAICGVGPFLPKSRKALGFTEQNTSPLFLLVNAFRRVDKGTKCLFAPNDVAKRYTAEFKKGVAAFIDDTLWWKAAQEEDQKQSTGGARSTTSVNTGDTPSDDIGDYLSGMVSSTAQASGNQTPQEVQSDTTSDTPVQAPAPEPTTSKLDELIQKSTKVNQLSGRIYKFGNLGSLDVRVYELNQGSIFSRGAKRPCFFDSDGIDCDFVYDPLHPLLAQYPITPKMLLLLYLSEKLKARDAVDDFGSVFAELVENSMQEAKIDRLSLQERASSAFDLLREKLTIALQNRAAEVVSCIHESTGEVEETITDLVQANPSLLNAFQTNTAAGFDAIAFVPPKTLYRLIERFPDDVFDGKVLQSPYSSIHLQDEKATERTRNEAKDRVLSFVKDALRIISGYNQRIQKNELARASLSVDFLLKELNS